MNECPVITIVSVIVAIFSFVIACWCWNTARKTLLHHILSDIQRDYRSAEMLHAISRLWNFYRKHGSNKFVAKYEKIRKADEKSEIEQIKHQGQSQQITLHYQRRLVSHFYRHLATLYNERILPGRILYSIWGETDLEIIPKVLIPIENRVRQDLTGMPQNPISDSHPLMKLYWDSKQYGEKAKKPGVGE